MSRPSWSADEQWRSAFDGGVMGMVHCVRSARIVNFSAQSTQRQSVRTRGPNKAIYASDGPVLEMRRVVPEALALDLPAEVLDNYL